MAIAIVLATCIPWNLWPSSDTIAVTAFQSKPIFYSLPDTITCESSILWNTGLDSNDFIFNWSNGSNKPYLNIDSNGNYFVSISDTNGCVTNSLTSTIVFDNFSSNASLGPDTNLCSGNVLYLKNGAENATNYSWSNGSSDSTLTITQSGNAFNCFIIP